MKWLPILLALLSGLAAGYWLKGDDDSPWPTPSIATGAELSPSSPTKAKGAAADTPVLTPEAEAAAARNGITVEWLNELKSQGQLDQLAALIPKIKNATPADFEALMDAVDQYGGGMKHTIQNLLATRWVKTDPGAMLSYIGKQPENQRWRLSGLLYGAWGREDPQAAFSNAQNIEDQRMGSSAMQAVINAISGSQPHLAVEMAQSLPKESGRNNSWLFRNIFMRWANTEPEAARQAALALPEGEDKVRALTGALGDWMVEDPVAALNWLDALPKDASIYNSRKDVFRDYLSRDFETARDFIAQRPDPLERSEVLQNIYFDNLVRGMDFEEAKGIYDWLGEVSSGETYDRKVGELARTMISIDPEQAINFTLNLPPGNARLNALSSLGHSLASQDPAKAIALVEGVVYEDEKQRLLQNMGWHMARYNTEKAAQLIAASTDPKVQQSLSRNITTEWSKYDREGALAWAEGLEDERARSSAMGPIFGNWLQSDPQSALAYIQASVPENKQNEYLRNGFSQLSRENPQAAVTWLERLPETPLGSHTHLYGQVASYYVRHDPMAASEWIAGMQEGPARDNSVQSLVGHISSSDPEAAFAWAATIKNESRRESSLSNSVREWARIDSGAARQAVMDADIDAGEKETLLKMIPQR